MRIGVDGTIFTAKQKTGIAYYAENLLDAVATALPDSEIILCVVGNQPLNTNFKATNIRVNRNSWLHARLLQGMRHYLVAPPLDLLTAAKADVFIFPNFVSWPLAFCQKSIVFVHDLAFVDVPEYISPRNRHYLSRKVPRSVSKATHILTISEFTKQRIIQQYGVAADKISVVEPAINHSRYFPASTKDIEKIRTTYGITKKYILYVGTLEPRKNIKGIVGAYQNLPDKLKDEYQLVLAGGGGWLDDDLDQAIQRLPAEQLIRPGYIKEEDKPALYSGADLFVYPSHYEGWGMQILEAMACGTPVITANNSSLPEVSGQAAKLINSDSTTELTKNIKLVLADSKLQAKLRQAGLQQAAKFNWDMSAQKALRLLDQITGKS